MTVSQRRVKVSKTDIVGIDVSDWANGETITSLTVTDPSTNSTVDSSAIQGDILLATIEGVTVGNATLHFEYATATRDDCHVLTVCIVGDC
jgi:hypothetical protein